MREFTDDLTPDEKKVLQDVAEQGVHIVHMPGEGDGPAFSFTVGLYYQFQQPEVIAFGLPEEVAEQLLNALTDEADDGKRFLHGETHDGLLVGYPVRFVDVPEDRVRDYCDTAHWAYGGEHFRCVQLVWPDKEKRWPWQDGVREGFRNTQPVLGTPGA